MQNTRLICNHVENNKIMFYKLLYSGYGNDPQNSPSATGVHPQ